MREFQDKRQWKRTFKSRYFIALLIIMAVLIAHGVWNAYSRYARSAVAVNNLEMEKDRLMQRQDDLDHSVQTLQTPEGVDREIRSTYGLVRPGEELIVVVGANEGSTSDYNSIKKGWWSRFVSLFK